MPDFDSAEQGVESVQPSSGSASPMMTLQKAVDLGEYDPEYLATFPEWHSLSRHVQFQFIQQGLENRNKQLTQQYAAICNILDFSKKPHLQKALRNLEEQTRQLKDEKEKLFMEYSKPED